MEVARTKEEVRGPRKGNKKEKAGWRIFRFVQSKPKLFWRAGRILSRKRGRIEAILERGP